MYDEVIKNLEKQLSDDLLEKIKSKRIHLGIFSEPYLTYMLKGKKTIESRFSKNKIAPYNQITKDDIVIIKKSSGNVVGYFTIKDVLFFDLRKVSINEIKSKYNNELCVDEAFWINKRNSNYATLIIIDKLFKLDAFHITKKGMQTWVILSGGKDGTYNETIRI